MDYEKKYKEALERAKEYLKEYYFEEAVKDIFPELAGSEDEKVRKALIEMVHDTPNIECEQNYNVRKEDCLAWLEKQGEQKPILNVPTREVILSIWDLGNEWKELTNGCISTEYGTQLDYIQKHWQESEYYLREKQGEQKPNYTTLVETGNGGINALVTKEITNGCDDEQKPFDYENANIQQKDFAPKVEPKFKVGDWVVNKGHSYLIADIDFLDNRYLFEIGGYTHEQLNWEYIENVDNKYHLWTIQDAKEGNVLYSLDSKQPFIFKHRKNNEQAEVYCGINIYGKFFVWNTKDCIITTDKYIPATKAQRDFLFKKMHEAGYEWDAEKKETKLLITNGGDFFETENCEQKSANTVEPKCEESKTKIFDAPTPFEDKLYAFVAACEFLTLPSKIEFIKEHSQELLDAAKEQAEKKHEEDMELIKGLLEELNKKTFKPPFDIKTFPESKSSDQFKPFDPWGHTCIYACPTAPYDPNITISTTDTLNKEERL